MTDDDDEWIPARQALEITTSWFATSMKLDETRARAEAKDAIIGELATGHLLCCPAGCLTSAFKTETGRSGDYSLIEYDENGNGRPIPMDVEHEGEYVYVPSEFWEMFRDFTAATSPNWDDGHFSFRLSRSNSVFAGEVRHLLLKQADLPGRKAQAGHVRSAEVSLAAVALSRELIQPVLAVGDSHIGSPRQRLPRGRQEKGRALYRKLHENRYENGIACNIQVDEAHILLNILINNLPKESLPQRKTIVNWLSKYGYGRDEKSQK